MLAASAASTEWSKVIRRVLQPVQHNVVVIAGFEIVKDMFDFAISVNQEADAMNAIVGFAHEETFHPRRRIVRTPGGPHQTGA